MRQSHLIISNTIIIWASKVLLLVPQIIFVPYLIGTIGETGYGVYAMIWPLMMSIDQLEITLQQGVVKYSAAFLAQRKLKRVNQLVSSSFIGSIIMAISVSAGIVITAFVAYGGASTQLGISLIIVGIMVLFIIPITPYIAVLQSQQYYYVNAIGDTISKYISLMLVIFWFRIFEPSVEALIVIMAATLLLARFMQIPIAYRFIPGLRNSFGLFDRESFRLIASFGLVTVLISLSLAINSAGIRWLMGSLVSSVFVAHLAILLMPGLMLAQIVTAMTTTVMPVTSACQATDNFRILRDLLLKGMRYTTVVVLAGVLAAVILIRDILNIWVGSQYTFLASYSLIFFGSIAFMLTTSVAHHMLKGLGKLKVCLLIYTVSFVLVPLAVIYTIYFRYRVPYIAVVFGLAAGNILCGILNIIYGIRSIDLSFRTLISQVYVMPLLFAALVSFIASAVIGLNNMGNLFNNIVVAFAAVIFFLFVCYLYATPVADRLLLQRYIRALFKN